MDYAKFRDIYPKEFYQRIIATEHDNYMTAGEAMDFGLIDKIIEKR